MSRQYRTGRPTGRPKGHQPLTCPGQLWIVVKTDNPSELLTIEHDGSEYVTAFSDLPCARAMILDLKKAGMDEYKVHGPIPFGPRKGQTLGQSETLLDLIGKSSFLLRVEYISIPFGIFQVESGRAKLLYRPNIYCRH